MHGSFRSLVILSSVVLSSLASGCATAPESLDDGTGELAFPLNTTDGHGTLYHMSAKFIVGKQTADGTGAGCSATVTVPATAAAFTLADGWVLRASMDNGVTYQQVPAVLAPDSHTIHVLRDRVTIFVYELLVDTPGGQQPIFFSMAPCLAAGPDS